MKSDSPHILLINPWIHDFAAYDFWARPLGLLTLGGILRREGYRVSYLDCLDRFCPWPDMSPAPGAFGKGRYLKTAIEKPKGLADVPRTYSRYGIPEPVFRQALSGVPRPDVVLVTSLMTYWYPGVFAVIRIVRELIPDVPVLLGGIYATLCTDHAVAHAGADQVIPGGAVEGVLETVGSLTGFSGPGHVSDQDLDTFPYPCLDLQSAIPFVPILTSRGCPFRCRYCASAVVSPGHQRRSPEKVFQEIQYWHEAHGVADFAFYDDALLIDGEHHIMPLLEKLTQKGPKVRFHTPNALHISPLSREMARLLFRAGFRTIRLGLETALFGERKRLDTKVRPSEFESAVTHLKEAGFTAGEVGAYLLFGLPGQDLRDLEASVRRVKACGIRPVLAQYSPIPHTALWDEAVRSSRYDLASDPIYQNNSVFPCTKEPFSWDRVTAMKNLTQ